MGEKNNSFEDLIWEFLAYNREEVMKLDREMSLDALVENGYIEREEVTTLTCNGKPTNVMLRCPNCGESNLEPLGAWIHTKCGSVSYKEGTCPRCGDVLPDDMVYIGPIYRCGKCGAIVNYPLIDTSCGEIRPDKAFIYRITEKGRKFLGYVKEILKSLPEPKAMFVMIGNLRVEALITYPRNVRAIILSSGEDARKRKLENLGIKVELIRISLHNS